MEKGRFFVRPNWAPLFETSSLIRSFLTFQNLFLVLNQRRSKLLSSEKVQMKFMETESKLIKRNLIQLFTFLSKKYPGCNELIVDYICIYQN